MNGRQMKPSQVFSSIAMIMTLAISILLFARESPPEAPPAPRGSFYGFDRDVYPGDEAFTTLGKTFSFTGYWLSPPPNEKTNTWTGKREFLQKSGFGFLVLYRGRDSQEFRNESDASAKGATDAQTAAENAGKDHFPAGTIIYLDVEEGGRLAPAYHSYLHAWADMLGRNSYRAGVYCSGMPAKEPGGVTILTADDIRDHAESREFTYFVYNDACPPSPGCSISSSTPSPAASGVSFARAWQFAQSPRRKEFAAKCTPGYNANGNCYAPGDRSLAWDLDMDTSTSANPSNASRH